MILRALARLNDSGRRRRVLPVYAARETLNTGLTGREHLLEALGRV